MKTRHTFKVGDKVYDKRDQSCVTSLREYGRIIKMTRDCCGKNAALVLWNYGAEQHCLTSDLKAVE